jgi:hypothetical protein
LFQGVLVRGARGTNLGANKLETLELVADFSVFEDFWCCGKTTLKTTWYWVWGTKDGVSGMGYGERGEFRFQ